MRVGAAQALKTTVPDNDMIEQLDLEQFAGFDQLACELQIFGAGGGIATGVVMGYHQRLGLVQNGDAKQFAGVCEGAIEQTGGDGMLSNQAIFGVEAQGDQLFLAGISQPWGQQLGHVFRAIEQWALGQFTEGNAFADFKGRQ